MLKTLFVSHRWWNVWMHLSNIKAANFAVRLRSPSWHTRWYCVQNKRDFSLRTFESCALRLWSTRRGALYKLNVGLIKLFWQNHHCCAAAFSIRIVVRFFNQRIVIHLPCWRISLPEHHLMVTPNSWGQLRIGMISQETVLLQKCLTLRIFGQFWFISSSEPLDEYGPSLYLGVSFIETQMCVCRSPPWFLFCCSNWGKKRIQARLMLCWTACQTSGRTRYWAPLASTVLIYNEFTSLQSNFNL